MKIIKLSLPHMTHIGSFYVKKDPRNWILREMPKIKTHLDNILKDLTIFEKKITLLYDFWRHFSYKIV
jgi:hypothetical protein